MSEPLRGQEKWKWKPQDVTLLKAKGFDPTAPPMTVITLDLGSLFASVFEAGKTL